MSRKQAALLLSLLSGIVLVLSSCGTTPNGQAVGGTNTVMPPGTATTQATATAQSTPRLSAGKVVITLGKTSYAPRETITATIANGLVSAVSAMDHQSVCTLLVLQKWEAGKWLPQAECRLKIATRMVPIAASTSLTQELSPADATPWSTGQYRLTLSYIKGSADMESRDGAGPATTIYSETFMVS